MTPEDKAYYSDGYYPLFKLMLDEFGLTLLEQDMFEIINCVRKMDEARGGTKITMLPLNEIEDMFMNHARHVTKVGVLNGGDIGLVIEYYNAISKQMKVQTIRPTPSY